MARRILLDNIGSYGSLDNDKVARALLQFRNTPLQDIGLSPAQLLYGRTLRDSLPTLEEAQRIRPEWRLLAEEREQALAKRHIRNIEHYDEHVKTLPPLHIGDTVFIQNQTGPRPTRWEKTGTIIEQKDNGQYLIGTHGSGRCTLRNRRFLRHCTPIFAEPIIQTNIDPVALTPDINDDTQNENQMDITQYAENPDVTERT